MFQKSKRVLGHFLLPVLLLFLIQAARAQNDPIYIHGPYYVYSGLSEQWYANVMLEANAELYEEDNVKILFYGTSLVAMEGAKNYGANASWTSFQNGIGTGRIVFKQANPMNNSTAQQLLSGGSIGNAGDGGNPDAALSNTFTAIEIDNIRGVRLAGSNSRVGTDILFTQGHLYLGNYDMTLSSEGTLTNYDKAKYVVTERSGHLVKENLIANSEFYFPVGMSDAANVDSYNNSDYTPATVSSAISNTIHVNVTDYANSASIEDAPTGVTGIDRTWNIFGNLNGEAQIALRHNSITNHAGFLPSDNFVTQFGTLPNNTGDLPSQGRWQANRPGPSSSVEGSGTETRSRADFVLATSSIASESYYTKDISGTPLPLTLLSFTAAKQSGNQHIAVLNWKVSEQVNTQSFVVERSADGVMFNEIGSKAAAGNYAGEMAYAFTDVSPVRGLNYYRLRMMDINGLFTYSEVKSLNFGETASIIITPNPAMDKLFVKGISAPVKVQVLDMAGKLLQINNVASQNEAVDISGLASAVYVVQVIENGQIIFTGRIMKQ